jgi:hypothetical protein
MKADAYSQRDSELVWKTPPSDYWRGNVQSDEPNFRENPCNELFGYGNQPGTTTDSTRDGAPVVVRAAK